MSAIGPGDTVQCIKAGRSNVTPERITAGSLYQVGRVRPSLSGLLCPLCGDATVLELAGDNTGLGWSICKFRKWPPPADEALRSESSPYDISEPVSA